MTSSSIDEAYRGQGILRSLFRNRLAFYNTFAENGIEFDATIADTVTAEGSGLAEKLGMKLKTVTEFGTGIYMGTYEDLKRKTT